MAHSKRPLPEPIKGPRPAVRGAPRERHFGFSGRYLKSSAANDNESSIADRIRRSGPWLLGGLAFAGLLSAALN